jgi:anti-sigma regulatory factor (Ser/Thr protein kinase)
MPDHVTPARDPDAVTTPGARRARTFARRCTAEPGNLPALRGELDSWLAGLAWPDDERADVVLAVSEACANAVDHAYPPGSAGDVAVVGRLGGDGRMRCVFLIVRDWGRWRRPPTDPGYRGHGLTVIRECMQRSSIHRGVHGTAVAMTSTAVPDVPTAVGPAAHPRIVRPAASDRRPPGTAGGHRHRRTTILRQAGRLRTDSAVQVANAEAAWRRAQSIMHTSTRLVAESRRRHAGRARADEAA